MSERYEGDYRCGVADGPEDPCRLVATQIYREPFTPAAFQILTCDEHARGLKCEGYSFDAAATEKLAQDIQREEMEYAR